MSVDGCLTSMLVDGTVALDAGSLAQALTLGEQAAVRHVFVSHSHLDHILTLPFFLKNIFGSVEFPVLLHGLPETLAALEGHIFNGTVWPDFAAIPAPCGRPAVAYRPLTANAPVEADGLRVTPIPVSHTVPTVGFLVEDGHSAFAYTSDTGPTDSIYEVANALPNLRLFITEASFRNSQGALAAASGHLTPAMLAKELGKLRPGVPAGIFHITPADRPMLVDELKDIRDRELTVLEQGMAMEW